MGPAKDLLSGIAALLWPVIVIAILLLFRPAVAAIIESARSRKFTLKIGGQELSMEEANQAQQKIITDLQTQVAAIQNQLHANLATQKAPRPPDVPSPSPVPPPAHVAPAPDPAPESVPVAARPIKSILWVDDNPENNKYYVGQLTELGIRVDTVRSTIEALTRIANRRYDCIISDMGRQEDNVFNDISGLDLLRAVRGKNPSIPFFFFSSPEAVAAHGQDALKLGATGLTSSQTRLFGLLRLGAAGVQT